MRINLIVDGLYDSGGMKMIFEYLNRLTFRGHRVVLYNPVIPYNFYNTNWCTWKYLKALKSKIGFFLKHKNMFFNKYINNFKISTILYANNMFIKDGDVVIATRWPTAYSVAKLSPNKGKKIYFIQGYENWEADITLVNNSYKLDLTRIVISNKLKNFLLNKFGVESNLVLNGIDFDTCVSANNVKKNQLVISFIDYELESKGTDLAIDIIIEIHILYPSVRILAFGYNKFHKIPEFVEFYENPSPELIKKIYSETDIFLFTSYEDGFGLPPAEAMAYGCAVITSKVGAVEEYSSNNISALYVNEITKKDYIEKLILLIENEKLRKELSINGSTYVREKLNWNNSIDKFERILKNFE